MCNEAKSATIALITTDKTTTEDERMLIEAALVGECKPLKLCDAAERLGVSRPTIYTLVRAGKLQRLPNGRISARSVADFLAGKIQCEAS